MERISEFYYKFIVNICKVIIVTFLSVLLSTACFLGVESLPFCFALALALPLLPLLSSFVAFSFLGWLSLLLFALAPLVAGSILPFVALLALERMIEWGPLDAGPTYYCI